jgi:predicted DNA-binding protein
MIRRREGARVPKLGRFSKWFGLALDQDFYRRLRAAAKREGVPVSVLVRQYITRGLDQDAARAAAGALTEAVRLALAVTEERLKGLALEAAELAATSVHLALGAMEAKGADTEELFRQARAFQRLLPPVVGPVVVRPGFPHRDEERPRLPLPA